jgi:hypothetical protein
MYLRDLFIDTISVFEFNITMSETEISLAGQNANCESTSPLISSEHYIHNVGKSFHSTLSWSSARLNTFPVDDIDSIKATFCSSWLSHMSLDRIFEPLRSVRAASSIMLTINS